MKGYDEQYACLLKFNVRDDYNTAKRIRERNRDLLNIRDIYLKRAEEYDRLATPAQIEANLAFIREFAFENVLEIEDDAVEYLSRMYRDKKFAKLKVKLERLVDKDFGYSHLRDLAVVVMPDIFFEKEFYMRYAEIANMIREKRLTTNTLAKALEVSEYPFRHVKKLDYILDMYLQGAVTSNLDAVEDTLFSLAIDNREFKAVSYILSNLRSDKFKGQYSADIKVTKSEVDNLLDEMSAEELMAMFNSMRNEEEGTED